MEIEINILYSFLLKKKKIVALTFPTTSTGETCQSTCCSGILGMAPHWGGQGQIYLRWKGYISILKTWTWSKRETKQEEKTQTSWMDLDIWRLLNCYFILLIVST